MEHIYKVTQNTDLVEGKGRQATIAFLSNELAAVTVVGNLAKNMGGGTSAEIREVPVFDTYADWSAYDGRPATGQRVWGYRKNWKGQWDEGWVDNRDAPMNDPEYAEFQRLLKKFS